MVESIAGADATLAVTGAAAPFTLAYGKDMVIWSKRGLAQPELRRSELVFAASGSSRPNYAWNDYAGIDVHGKTSSYCSTIQDTPPRIPKFSRAAP